MSTPTTLNQYIIRELDSLSKEALLGHILAKMSPKDKREYQTLYEKSKD